MADNKLKELFEEFRTVMSGRARTGDALFPPVVFLLVNGIWGFTAAMWSALAVTVGFAVLRLVRRQPLGYAFGGLGAVLLAIVLSLVLNRAEGFFLPTLLTSGLLLVVCVASVGFGRPLAAYTSHLTRGWPLKWYLHSAVRPAYVEVTWMWALFIGLRLAFQTYLYQRRVSAGTLAWANILLGWPVTVLVLAVSYLYGTWRLQRLNGPSVEEFESSAEPPWEGQRRGF